MPVRTTSEARKFAPRKQPFFGVFGVFLLPSRKPLWYKGLRRSKHTKSPGRQENGVFGVFHVPSPVFPDDFSDFRAVVGRFGTILRMKGSATILTIFPDLPAVGPILSVR